MRDVFTPSGPMPSFVSTESPPFIARRVQLVPIGDATVQDPRDLCVSSICRGWRADSLWYRAWLMLCQVGIYTDASSKERSLRTYQFVQATKFELVINVETARMLGLIVPPDAARPRRRGDRMRRRDFLTLLGGRGGMAAGGARAARQNAYRRPDADCNRAVVQQMILAHTSPRERPHDPHRPPRRHRP